MGEPAKNPQVVMETSLGNITLELAADKAPLSTKNFLQYVDDGYYDGTIFHRIISNFMIQGGGMTPDMRQKTTRATIKNEGGNGLRNKRGTVAMARTSVPDSATSQFFINVVDNGFLDRDQSQDHVGYAVFGLVTEGLDVVDKIKAVKTGAQDVPREPVIIQKVYRKK